MAEDECGPLGRTGHVAVTYGSYMIVWGGYKEHEDNQANVYFSGSELWIYNVLTEKWHLRKCLEKDIPPGTSGAAAVLLDNCLYVFGGYQEEGNTNSLYRLSLSDFRWELLHPKGCIPTPVDKLVGWEHDGKLYFFGGFGIISQSPAREQPSFQFILGDTYSSTRRGWTNQFISYNPSSNEWTAPTTKGSIPVPRAAHAAAIVNNKVYIFGGRHHNFRKNDLHYLNLDTMEWSGELAIEGSLPAGRSWHSFSALSESSLVLYGGFSQSDIPLSDCWILDISIMKWKKIDLPFRKPRLWHTACVSAFNEIIIYGGCTGNILDHRIVVEHAKDIIVLRFSPKSLFRLCVDMIVKYSDHFVKHFPILPSRLQYLLNIRLNKENSRTSNIDVS